MDELPPNYPASDAFVGQPGTDGAQGATGPANCFATQAGCTVNYLDYNVLSYGAVGDGTTDDSSAIQAAIDAVAAAGGGTLNIPSRHYKLGSPLIARSGVTLSGRKPTLQVVSTLYNIPVITGGTTVAPDDTANMIDAGGSWLDCTGLSSCITGRELRNFNVEHLGMKHWTGSMIKIGGDNVEGLSFAHWTDIIGIGNSALHGSAIGIEMYNFQHIVASGIRIVSLDTCMRLGNWNSTYNGGNSTFGDVYCNVAARSASNGNNTPATASVQLVSLPTSVNTAFSGGLNDVHFPGLQINETMEGTGSGDGTGTSFSMIGANNSAAKITGIDFSGADFENFAPGDAQAVYGFNAETFNGQFAYFFDFANLSNTDSTFVHASVEAPGLTELGKDTLQKNNTGLGWETANGCRIKHYMGSDDTLGLYDCDGSPITQIKMQSPGSTDPGAIHSFRQEVVNVPATINGANNTVQRVVNYSNDASFLTPEIVFAPNLASGHNIERQLLVDNSATDGAASGYHYDGAGSLNNYAYLGTVGKPVLKVFGDGQFSVNNGKKINDTSQICTLDGSGCWVTPPSSSTSTCTQGQQAADANYSYDCYADNHWGRAALQSSGW